MQTTTYKYTSVYSTNVVANLTKGTDKSTISDVIKTAKTNLDIKNVSTFTKVGDPIVNDPKDDTGINF